MFCLRKSDVIRFAHNDVASDGRNNVMFAYYAVWYNITYIANIIVEGYTTYP